MKELITKFLAAKNEETLATARRIELGNELAKALGGAPEEGSKTHDVDEYKVTLKGVMNRKVDMEALDALKLDNPPIKVKRELDIVGLKWYEQNDRETFLKISKTITATPGRTQVEVKHV